MELGKFIFSIYDGLLDGIYQLNLYKKSEKGLKCFVDIVYDNRMISTVGGQLTEDRKILYVPSQKRIYFNPIIYEKNGRQMVLIPDKSHGNIDHKLIKNVANAQKTNLLLTWTHARKWVTLRVKEATGTMDFNLFDNDLSPNFSREANKVLQSKALEFLEMRSDTKFILSMIICLSFGFITGTIFSIILLKFI